MTIPGIALTLLGAFHSIVDTSQRSNTVQLDSAATDTVWRSGKPRSEPLYSFWADQIPLSQAIQLFAKANDLSIEAPSNLTMPVRIDFRNTPLPRALEAILGPHGMAWEQRGKSVRVLGSSDTRLFRIDYLRFKRAGSGSSQASISTSGSGQAGRVTVNTSDELQFWDELELQIKALLSESGKLVTNRTAGTLWVKDAQTNLTEIDRYLTAVSNAVGRQVELTARIYEVTLGDDHSLGIDWTRIGWSGTTSLAGGRQMVPVAASVGTSNISTGSEFKPVTMAAEYALGGNSLNVVLSALAEQGEVRAVSQPRIVTLNNQPALIKVGTDMPYFVSTVINNGSLGGTTISEEVRIITLGVVLSVTPQISADGKIQLGIEPLVTSLVGTETSRNGSTAPIVDVKQSSSMATLRDRETVRLSGLIQESTSKTERKVPLLGDIPLLGALFRWTYNKTSNRELVIFVTPRILD